MLFKKLMLFTDFTEGSSVAAWHCFQIASLCKAEVISFHNVIENEDINWAEKKCIEQIRKIGNYDADVSFLPLASKQNLFLGLNKWLEKHEVELTFFATHGKKDIQFLRGSDALKLIFNAETPTMVVQKNAPLRPYRNILLPVLSSQGQIDFQIQALQTIGSIFNSTLTLFIPKVKNDLEEKEIKNTVAKLKEILDHSFSDIKLKESNQTEAKFIDSVMTVIVEENIDLVGLLIGAKHHRELAGKNKKFSQSLITNPNNVPVLCL